jgi:hypothetical protein
VIGRHVVMEDDDRTLDTLEFPPEPEPELTDEDIIDVMPLWAPVVGSC